MSEDRVLTGDEVDAILKKLRYFTAGISGQEIRNLITTINAVCLEGLRLREEIGRLERERDEMRAEQKGGV